MKIFKSGDCEVVKIIDVHTDCVMSAFFDDSGKYIVTASLDKRAIIFSAKDYSVVKEIEHFGQLIFADFD